MLSAQQIEELNFRTFLHKAGSVAKKIVNDPTVRDVASYAGHAAVDRYLSKEELEELSLKSFLHKAGHAVSVVAHNPIAQDLAKQAGSALIKKYTKEQL